MAWTVYGQIEELCDEKGCEFHAERLSLSLWQVIIVIPGIEPPIMARRKELLKAMRAVYVEAAQVLMQTQAKQPLHLKGGNGWR